ncbi:MAG: FAD binding domain-containing protein [Treponema sp.]|jgi:CO/xanthine dehydrogenase FAD-binding subunit|nr:FAD binding domain-containing protein [Treponema sp.]
MAEPLNQVFFPSSLQELFSAWSRFPDAQPFAGGVGLIQGQGNKILELPKNILSMDKLEELHRITRTERYLEIGAMVPLNKILALGKIVPEAMKLCLQNIAGPQMRNVITIGGNICYPGRRLNLAVPLVALDAHYELRNSQNIRWISAARFSSLPGKPAINQAELLTRIRIPLDQWNYTIFRKFRRGKSGNPGEVMLFLIKNQKNVLTDIRVIFGAETILRDKNSETLLIGKQLPLGKKDALDFVEHWRTYLFALESPVYSPESEGAHPALDDLTKAELLNFIESNILTISE